MYLVLNYKLFLFGNYLIKRFDILFGFINPFNLVLFGQQHAVLERGGDMCYILVSKWGSVPALTWDGDLWDSEFNDFQCFGIESFRKKSDTILSSIIWLVVTVTNSFIFAREYQVSICFRCLFFLVFFFLSQPLKFFPGSLWNSGRIPVKWGRIVTTRISYPKLA